MIIVMREYSGNQVTSISDMCSGPYYQGAYHFRDGADEAVEYAYDANGNMTMDLNRGISSISYDENRRPRSVEFASGASTRYIYSADGVKLQTRHRTPTLAPAAGMEAVAQEQMEESVTDYCGPVVYEDGELWRVNLDNGYLNYRGAQGELLDDPVYMLYHRDHLGNNRVTMDAQGGIYQIDHYYPFGLPMGSGYNSAYQRWRFGGKELDRTAGLDLYDFEARAYDPTTARFTRPDDLAGKYHPLTPFGFCANNPLRFTDPTGEEVTLYATKLPGASWVPKATHTFIVVTDENGNIKGYFAYGSEYDGPRGTCSGKLQQNRYTQDLNVINGTDVENLKAKIPIPVPVGMTQEEFDNAVISTAKSFGNNPEITYNAYPYDLTEGNCNSSTSTILLKSGVSLEQIKLIKGMIPGISWGFNPNPKPWTAEEQKNAVDIQKYITIIEKIGNSHTALNIIWIKILLMLTY